jgi:hypothetical protein
MTERTARYGMPLLLAGQGQKDVTHNEALLVVDALLCPVVEHAELATPPVDPVAGQCWLIPAVATDAWESRRGQLAAWTAGGWRFLELPSGASLFDRHSGRTIRRTDTGWMIDRWRGEAAPAIATPSGGPVIDTEARAAIEGLITRLVGIGLISA